MVLLNCRNSLYVLSIKHLSDIWLVNNFPILWYQWYIIAFSICWEFCHRYVKKKNTFSRMLFIHTSNSLKRQTSHSPDKKSASITQGSSLSCLILLPLGRGLIYLIDESVRIYHPSLFGWNQWFRSHIHVCFHSVPP